MGLHYHQCSLKMIVKQIPINHLKSCKRLFQNSKRGAFVIEDKEN